MIRPRSSAISQTGQAILLLTAAAGLVYLLSQLRHLINPLGYALLIGVVLYPLRKQPVARALAYATFTAAGLWFLYDSGHLFIPFVLAYVIAFLVNPLVLGLEKRGIPRWLGAVVISLSALGIISLLMIVGVPFLWQQASTLAKVLNQANTNADEWLATSGFLELAGKVGVDASVIKTKILPRINHFVSALTGGLMGEATTGKTNAGNVFTVGFFLILQPFLLYFFVRDYDRIGEFIRLRITPRNVSVDYARQISRILGNYLRGQFIVVIISMINLSFGFWMFGVPYGILLGIFSGLTNFIPTFGLWLSIFVTSVVAATFGDPWYTFLPGLYITFGIEQILETGFIVPRVIGRHVGLHPVIVMLSLLIFGFMFGFLGVLIAVPTVALSAVFWEQYRETHQLPFFKGAELENEDGTEHS